MGLVLGEGIQVRSGGRWEGLEVEGLWARGHGIGLWSGEKGSGIGVWSGHLGSR